MAMTEAAHSAQQAFAKRVALELRIAAKTKSGAWSGRAVARAADVSPRSVSNLAKLGLVPATDLGPVDVLVVMTLDAVGANRPTNRSDPDPRTAALIERDRRVAELVRNNAAALSKTHRLVLVGTCVSLLEEDHEVQAAAAANRFASYIVVPVGMWAATLAGHLGGAVDVGRAA